MNIIYLMWVIHNVIIHPLMMLMSVSKANALHDANAIWAFKLNTKVINDA